jgi:two-component system NtrC family sensor kinase
MSVVEQITAAIETISDGFALLDSDHRFVVINAPFRHLYANAADALVVGGGYGDFSRRLAIAEGLASGTDAIEAHVRERMTRLADPGPPFEYRMPDGRWIRIADSRTGDGGTVCLRTDVTERKQREQALAENEARTRAIVEGALDAIVTVDETGAIIEFNLAAEHLFGLPRASVLGQPVGETIVPHAQRASHHAGFARYLATGERRLIGGRIEIEALRGDGSLFPIEMTMTELRLGERRLFTAFIRDLTGARRLEREMAEQRDRLAQSHKLGALGSLLAGVAHELNNPLSIVVAQAMLLEETAADERSRERGARIRAAADRCDKIVRSFLAMARQRRPQRSAVDVARVVDDVVSLVGYGLRSAGVEVARDIPDGLPPVWADPDQLNQVLTNLVVNAQQALMETPMPRHVAIAAKSEGGELAITVADNGPGVPAEARNRIFEPFYTTKPVGFGTGVGLAVCHGIVDSYGGSISVEDAPGGGALFRVRLPLGSPAEGMAPAQSQAAPAVHRSRVLVIDDEAEIAATLREILEEQGHGVDTAENGAAALELISRKTYDLVLCDLRMPGMDGPAFYRRLGADAPRLARRMVVVTGDTLNGAARVFLQETGLPRLEKPFRPADVRRIVAQALSGGESA